MKLYLFVMAAIYLGGLATALASPRLHGRWIRIGMSAALSVWPVLLFLRLP
jgi:hypothetical protein